MCHGLCSWHRCNWNNQSVTIFVCPALIWNPLWNVSGKLPLLVTVPMNPWLSTSTELVEDRSLWASKIRVRPWLTPSKENIIRCTRNCIKWKCKLTIHKQWAPLTRITVNCTIWLMGSNWPRLNKHQISLNTILCVGNMFNYCYHLINGIRFILTKSEPNQQWPLYIDNFLHKQCKIMN